MKKTLVAMGAVLLSAAVAQTANAAFVVNFTVTQLTASTFRVTGTDASDSTDFGIAGYVLDLGKVGGTVTGVTKSALSAPTSWSDTADGNSPGDGNDNSGPTVGFDTNLTVSTAAPYVRQLGQGQSGLNGAQFNIYGVGKGAAPYPNLSGASYVSPDAAGTNYFYSASGGTPVYTKSTNTNLTTANAVLGTGTFTGSFGTASTWLVSANANVYITGPGSNASAAAQTSVTFVPLVSSLYKFALDNGTAATTLGGTSAGSTTVVGSNGAYYDTSINHANSAKNYVDIANASLGIGTQVPVWVLVSFNLGTSGTSLDTLRTNFLTAGNNTGSAVAGISDSGNDSSGGMLTTLLAQYAAAGFTTANSLLFQYTTAPRTGSPDLNFGFDLTGSGITATGVVATPEPASLGLLALGALGLIGRRRSSK